MWRKWGENMVDILYEDNHIIVAIKPQNVPSQADTSGDLDMLTMIKQYVKEKYNKPGNAYIGLVHRLDRPTGGIMVFAKTSKAAKRLCEQIKTKDFVKKYLCVVVGKPNPSTGTLTNYIKKDEKNNVVKIVPQSENGAKLAILDYKVIEKSQKNYSLVEILLTTGRSHQIRVQMSNIKNPLFGDVKYGYNGRNWNLALWAYKLSFVHPVTKQNMHFTVYPPVDEYPWDMFSGTIEKLK